MVWRMYLLREWIFSIVPDTVSTKLKVTISITFYLKCIKPHYITNNI